MEQADSRLNLTLDEANDVIERILPLGMPSNADSDVCILVQTDYVSGYSSKFQMPLWTAFTFTPVSWFWEFHRLTIRSLHNRIAGIMFSGWVTVLID